MGAFDRFARELRDAAQRVDYFDDNWNLIFPGWEFMAPSTPIDDFYVSVKARNANGIFQNASIGLAVFITLVERPYNRQ